LGDFVEDKNHVTPDDVVIESSLRRDINNVLTSLSQKESDSNCGEGFGAPRVLPMAVCRQWQWVAWPLAGDNWACLPGHSRYRMRGGGSCFLLLFYPG